MPTWRHRVRHIRPARYERGASYVDEPPEGWRPVDRAWVAERSGDIADIRFARRHMWMRRFNGLGILDRFGVTDVFRP